MYKSKIRDWGFDKKLKGNEVRAVVRVRRQRLAAGKASTFRIRGQVIDFEKVRSHLQRKGLKPDDIPSASNSPAPSLECFTPEPVSQETSEPCLATANTLTLGRGQRRPRVPSPWSVSAPDTFRASEQLFKSISIYFTESFASAGWAFLDRHTGLVNVTHHKPTRLEWRPDLNWGHVMTWAGIILNNRGAANIATAGQHLQQAFIRCEDAVRTETPSFVTDLLQALDNLETYNQTPEVARMLLRHIHSVSCIVLGKEHPLASISRQLSCLDTWRNISVIASNVASDICGKFLGPDHVYPQKLRQAASLFFPGRYYKPLAELEKRDFLLTLQQSLRPDPYVYSLAQFQLAFALLQHGKLETDGTEAETLLRESGFWGLGEHGWKTDPEAPVLGARSLFILAELQERRGEIALAEETLRYRCEKCDVFFGQSGPTTQAAIAEYRNFLSRHGPLGAAVVVDDDHPTVDFEFEGRQVGRHFIQT
jgi:hypothetical protein